MNTNVPPDKFLKVLHRLDDGDVVGLTACADFDLGVWRSKKLAEHLLNWLPHFALRPSEIENIGGQNPFKMLKDAAARIFKKESSLGRGEIGELLLHIIAVTEYRAHAFVSRLFYKMRSNDQITGFDSALVTYDEDTDEVELWLGEAKFYQDTKSASTTSSKPRPSAMVTMPIRSTCLITAQSTGFLSNPWASMAITSSPGGTLR